MREERQGSRERVARRMLRVFRGNSPPESPTTRFFFRVNLTYNLLTFVADDSYNLVRFEQKCIKTLRQIKLSQRQCEVKVVHNFCMTRALLQNPHAVLCKQMNRRQIRITKSCVNANCVKKKIV